MEQRISREALNIQIAGLLSRRGTCKRLQVGAVITFNNKIVGTGYNGPAKTEEHCNDFMCNKDIPCRRAVHAEINALNSSKLDDVLGWNYDGQLILYCTHQPCLGCAIQLESYIKTVYYLNEYRDKAGIELLKSKGINVIRIDLNGIPQD